MKYADAFDIAHTVVFLRRKRFEYPEEIAREAALAAASTENIDESINAMCKVFEDAEYLITCRQTNHQWNGSIA